MTRKKKPPKITFRSAIKGYICSHADKYTGELIDGKNAVKWLASHFGKPVRTVSDYLTNPRRMSADAKFRLKRILSEDLDSNKSIDAMIILIDSIPERRK